MLDCWIRWSLLSRQLSSSYLIDWVEFVVPSLLVEAAVGRDGSNLLWLEKSVENEIPLSDQSIAHKDRKSLSQMWGSNP